MLTLPSIETYTGTVTVKGTAPVGSMVTIEVTPGRYTKWCSPWGKETRRYVAKVRPDGTWAQTVKYLRFGTYQLSVTAGGEPKKESPAVEGQIVSRAWIACA